MPRVKKTGYCLVLALLTMGAFFFHPGIVPAKNLDTIRFRPLRCMDTAGTGDEAFSLLVPEGWKFTGGVEWVLDNPAVPATAAFSVSSPGGKTVFQVLPTQRYFWTNIPKILNEFPPGSRYYGGEVRAPMQPLEALKTVIIPKFRPNAKNIKVLVEQRLPRLTQGLSAGVLSQPDAETAASGARIRIQYTSSGIQVEEEIYCVVETILYHFASPTGTQTTMMWNIDYILSFRSTEKMFEDRAGILQTLSFSFRWNPQWFSKYSQLVATLMGRRVRRLKDMEQLTRILGRAKSEVNESIMGFYREREGVYTGISERFKCVIRAVEPFHNPMDGIDVELPLGYPSAWANSQGEYALSRTPGFHPNPDSRKDWQQIQPVRDR
jgi:hypothetical protein